MKIECLDEYLAELIELKLIDEAVCMGYDSVDNGGGLNKGYDLFVSPNFLYPLSKDSWTYFDAKRINKIEDSSNLKLFTLYRITSKNINKKGKHPYSLYVKAVDENGDVYGDEILLLKSHYWDSWCDSDICRYLYMVTLWND